MALQAMEPAPLLLLLSSLWGCSGECRGVRTIPIPYSPKLPALPAVAPRANTALGSCRTERRQPPRPTCVAVRRSPSRLCGPVLAAAWPGSAAPLPAQQRCRRRRVRTGGRDVWAHFPKKWLGKQGRSSRRGRPWVQSPRLSLWHSRWLVAASGCPGQWRCRGSLNEPSRTSRVPRAMVTGMQLVGRLSVIIHVSANGGTSVPSAV